MRRFRRFQTEGLPIPVGCRNRARYDKYLASCRAVFHFLWGKIGGDKEGEGWTAEVGKEWAEENQRMYVI